MYYNCLLCLLCIYCFFPLSYCPVVSTTDADAPVIDYVVDDRTPLLSSFQASSAPPLSQIPPIFLYFIYRTRHMLLLCCVPIQLHSLSLSPIVIPFRYP